MEGFGNCGELLQREHEIEVERWGLGAKKGLN